MNTKSIIFHLKTILPILFLLVTVFGCQTSEDDTVDPMDSNNSTTDPDITSYSNPAMDGYWSSNGPKIYIEGNDVLFCRVLTTGPDGILGYLSEDYFIYIQDGDTAFVPYTFDGNTLNTNSREPFSTLTPSFVDFVRDSDYNPCIGNVSNTPFMFQFQEDGYLMDYKVYINDEFLFDKSSIEEGTCAYSITPSFDYTIDVYIEYTYCDGSECAFNPENIRTARFNKTLQLQKLTDNYCNVLKIYFHSGTKKFDFYQIY